jgi:methylglutaconyl-CoA hydratase
MATSNLTELSFDGPIATLALNRPEYRNALSLDLLAALHQSVDALHGMHAKGVGPTVCVVASTGRAFCAGMDLKQVLGDASASLALLSSLAELTWKLRTLPCVTIASVAGPAIGGGCGLVTVCDMAVTFSENKMGFPEVDMGVCPAVVAPWLVRKIGPGRARRVLLAGGLMSGLQGFELGIVDQLVPTAEDVMPAVNEMARRLAGGSLAALAATKGLLNELDGSVDLALLLRAAKLSSEVLQTPRAQELLRAKMAK